MSEPAKTFMDRFPDPGPMPDVAAAKTVSEVLARDAWIKAHRQHTVAACVDAIMARFEAGEKGAPERTLALVLGTAYLDNTLHTATPFGMLGGGGTW